jgi:hypothetical protein
MAAATYTTDLVALATADEASGWVELSGTDGSGFAYDAQGSPAHIDTSAPYIQGSYAVTQITSVSGAMASLAYESFNVFGVFLTNTSGVFIWQNYSAPFAMGTYAQGGQRIAIGSSVNDFSVYNVGGSDKDNNPYGGFVNHVVTPFGITADETAGTPTSTKKFFGSATYVVNGGSTGVHQCDVIRHGRGKTIVLGGDGTFGHANIESLATENDLQANRWGLMQKLHAGYLFKGLLSLGSSSAPVSFIDSDRIILIQWTPKVYEAFNAINVSNSGSTVSLTRFQFITLDPATTASRGNWLAVHDATVTLDDCQFSDMFEFQFHLSTTVTLGVFNRCNNIIQRGATLTNCLFNSFDGVSSVVTDNSTLITGCTFTGDGSNHAMEATTPGDYDWNNTAIGYASANGSTGNEIYYNNSGGHINITRQGGTALTSVRNGAGATTTVKEANPANVPLGNAAGFGIMCQLGITGTGTAQGHVGSMTAITPVTIVVASPSVIYGAGAAETVAAKADYLLAITDINSRVGVNIGPAAYQIGGQTLTRGVYDVTGAITTTSALTLDGENDPNAVFIIRGGAAMSMAASIEIILINGAQAKNVFWRIVGAVSLGAGAHLEGTVLGLSTFGFGAAAEVKGRVLCGGAGSTVAMAASDIESPDPGITLTLEANVSLVGAEIRIYDLDETLPDLGTELGGVESVTTATYDFVGGAGSQGNVVWIQIQLTGYEEFGQQITMPEVNGSIFPVLQVDNNN